MIYVKIFKKVDPEFSSEGKKKLYLYKIMNAY